MVYKKVYFMVVSVNELSVFHLGGDNSGQLEELLSVFGHGEGKIKLFLRLEKS